MWLKYFFIVSFFMIYEVRADPASVGVMALSAASSIDSLTQEGKKSPIRDFFSPKGGLVLEKIKFNVDEHLNEDRPVRLHLVIFYEKTLETLFLSLSAAEYFRGYKQILKDYPNKVKVLEWQFPAEKRSTDKIKVEYEATDMVPAGGMIFVSYNGPGAHRMRVPPSEEEVEITLGQDDFERVTAADKKNQSIQALKEELKGNLDEPLELTDKSLESLDSMKPVAIED